MNQTTATRLNLPSYCWSGLVMVSHLLVEKSSWTKDFSSEIQLLASSVGMGRNCSQRLGSNPVRGFFFSYFQEHRSVFFAFFLTGVVSIVKLLLETCVLNILRTIE